jgi:hypothetical protein
MNRQDFTGSIPLAKRGLGPAARAGVHEKRSSGPAEGPRRRPSFTPESEVAEILRYVTAAGLVVSVEAGRLVVTGSPSRLDPGVGAALETLEGRELLVQKVLGGAP